MPEAFRIPTVIDHRSVFQKHVRDRCIIYLDNNIWIRFNETSNILRLKTLELCQELVNKRVVIFPLSYPAIKELIRGRTESELLQRAQLMGALSERIFFRSVKFIEQLECYAACPIIFGEGPNQADITEMFTYMVDLLGNSEIAFPEGWSHEDAENFIQDFRVLTFHSAFVKWFCKKMIRSPKLVQLDSAEEQYPEKLGKIIVDNATDFRYADGRNLNRDRMLLEERTNVFRRILPVLRNEAIKRFGLERVLQLRKSESEKNKLDILMKAMPSLETSCQLNAARGMNPSRKVRRQDFWDNWHVAYLPYVDFFVTGDGGLCDLLTNRMEYPRVCLAEVIYVPRKDAALTTMAELLEGLLKSSRSV